MSTSSNDSRVAVILYGRQAQEFERIKAALIKQAGVEVRDRDLVMAAIRLFERERLCSTPS